MRKPGMWLQRGAPSEGREDKGLGHDFAKRIKIAIYKSEAVTT